MRYVSVHFMKPFKDTGVPMHSEFDSILSVIFCYVMHVNILCTYPDSKVHGANIGPTWVLSSPGGPHVGPMKLALWVCMCFISIYNMFCALYDILVTPSYTAAYISFIRPTNSQIRENIQFISYSLICCTWFCCGYIIISWWFMCFIFPK